MIRRVATLDEERQIDESKHILQNANTLPDFNLSTACTLIFKIQEVSHLLIIATFSSCRMAGF